jgi:hypothetical protein
MILPTARQIEIIAECLKTGVLAEADPRQLAEPWSDYFDWCSGWLEEAEPGPRDPKRICFEFVNEFTARSREDRDCYQLILDAMEQPIAYPSAEQALEGVDQLEWLWKGWLLRGLPSLLAAVPGTGKSYLALDLALRTIVGGIYPDGQQVEVTGPVLYVDAENTPAIHKERVKPWPAPALRQLYLMLPAPERFLINLDDARDRDRLLDMCYVLRPALVIVDSYGACTLKGENNKEDVQSLLAFFNVLAREFRCGLLVVHHLRKGAPTQLSYLPMTIDNIRGSSHIAAVARHIWGLQFVPTGPEMDANGPRRLWVMKSNVGRAPAPLGVRFQSHPAYPDVAQLMYGEAPQPYRDPTRTEECADWLLATLMEAGEPLRPAELIELAEAQGYYKSIIYRARKQLGDLVDDTENPRHPQNAWALTEWSQSGNIDEVEGP